MTFCRIDEYATNKQIKVNGQPLAMKAIEYPSARVSIAPSLIGGSPALPEGEFHSVCIGELDQLGDKLDEQALFLS